MKRITIRICSEPSETSPTGKLYYFEVLEKIWFLQKWNKITNYNLLFCSSKEELLEKISGFKSWLDIVDPYFVYERKPCYRVRDNRWHINWG